MLPSLTFSNHKKTLFGYNIEFSGYNVGLENALLLIKDSKNSIEIYSNIENVVNECLKGEYAGKASTLPSYVVEAIFLEMRKISNGTEIPVRFKCTNLIEDKVCNQLTEVVIDLEKLEYIVPNDLKDVYEFDTEGGRVYIKLKQLSSEETKLISPNIKPEEKIYMHIDYVTFNDETISKDDVSKEEYINWCKNIPFSIHKEMTDFFFSKVPHISLKIPFKCCNENCNHSQSIEYTSVLDFFI